MEMLAAIKYCYYMCVYDYLQLLRGEMLSSKCKKHMVQVAVLTLIAVTSVLLVVEVVMFSLKSQVSGKNQSTGWAIF